MGLETKSRRERGNKVADDVLAANYIKVVVQEFSRAIGLKYLYLDALYE